MRCLVAAAVALLMAAGCTASPGTTSTGQGGSAHQGGGANGPGSGSSGAPRVTVRLGFVANVTQSPAIVGIRERLFAANLGRAVALRPVAFASDSAEAAALSAGRLDVAYASPDTILKVLSARRASRIVVISGASAAEPELVVDHRLDAPSELPGHTLAVPTTDGAQEIALRGWLAMHHLSAGTSHGIAVTAISPGSALIAAFRSGKIAGAIELPPWDIELATAGGRVLARGLDFPGSSDSATANLVVTRKFLDSNSAAVYALLKGQVQANDFLHRFPLQSSQAIAAALAAAGHPISSSLLALSMAQVSFTDDPLARSLAAQAREATADGFAAPAAVPPGLYDFAPLDLVLRADGEPPVTS
jgi:NitT/TauT family transport system substrate-binding protein